jgi:5-methylcytosine-specific restriction protein B
MDRNYGELESMQKTEAAEYWKERCLLNHGSVFTDEHLWTQACVAALDQYFVNNLDFGEGDFFAKLESQLEPTEANVKRLAAEMVWVMLLFPTNIGPESKRNSIARIWSWSGSQLEL